MNVQQLLRLIARLCELEAADMKGESLWICGPHRFTAPIPRDRQHSQSLWAMDGLRLQAMSWHELMAVADILPSVFR